MNSPQTISPLQPETEAEHIRIERRAARMDRRRRRQRTRYALWSTIGITTVLLGLMGFIYLQIEHIIGTNSQYPPISGISCDPAEQLSYHIHIHLTIYINGKQVTIPTGIGIAADQSCFYWMHTHTDDGIIHIEAPSKLHNLALDDFLTVWEVGFTKLNFPPEMTRITGWQIFVDGKPFAGVVTSPLQTEVPLASHDFLTLEYGSPNPPPDKLYVFPSNLKT